MRLKSWIKKSALGLILAFSATAQAGYPEKPVNIVVGYKAGGGVDTYARSLAKVASKHLDGQPLVVVNKPGGGGLIGGRFVADQPANGYSLYLASAGSMILRNLKKRQVVGTDDFKMVATVGELTAGVFVPASSPVNSLAELIEALKAEPKKLRWGHTGKGNVWHIAGVGLLKKNDAKAKAVPFKGGSGVRSAVIGKQIDFAIMGAHLGRGFEDDVKLLAVLSDERHPAVPDTPTAKELGVAFTKVSSPIIVMAPKRTKDAVVKQLSKAVQAMTQEGEYIDVMGNVGLPTISLSAEQSATLVQDAKSQWTSLVK